MGISSFVILTLAAPAAERGAPLSGKEIYQRTLKSTVWIARIVELGEGKAALATGSGSLIDVSQKLILTNFHVVGDQKEVRVFFPQFDKQGKLIASKDHYMRQLREERSGLIGKVVYADHKRDLALVKVDKLPAGTTAVPLAREGVGPGDTVHSLGNPGASDALWSYTPGAVKSVYKKSWNVKDHGEVHHFEAQVVETTSPVNPGDSGGPLLNGQGELVAVTQGGVSSQGTISFFIDICEVRALLAGRNIRINNGPAVARLASSVEPKPEPPPKDAAAEQANRVEREEKAARAKLTLIEEYVKDRPDRARERLEELIKQYPDTKAAKEAKDLLAKLKRA